MSEMRPKPRKRNVSASGETQGEGDAGVGLQTAMSRQLDEVCRQLEEGVQRMARQGVEIDRLQKLLAELNAAVKHLEAEVNDQREAGVTSPEPAADQSVDTTDEPSQPPPPDSGQVEARLLALMGLPVVPREPLASGPGANPVEERLRIIMGLPVRTQPPESVRVCPPGEGVNGDLFDWEATASKQDSLELVTKRRLANRHRRQGSQSPVLHMTLGGLIAACAGLAMQWSALTKPMDRRPETPLMAELAALKATVARLEARQALVPPSPAMPAQKSPAFPLPVPFPAPPLRIAGATIQPLLPRLTEASRIPAAPLASSSSAAESGTKPPPAAKDKKARKNAVPPPELAKKGGPTAIADVSAKKAAPPPGLAEKTLPKPKAKAPPKPVVESELVLINGGTVVLGDGIDGLRDALPHRVTLSPYLIGRHEVTLELWEKVRNWGRDHGYDLPAGMGKDARHPVYAVVWAEAVKWCNARSEMEKLTPCYYEDRNQKAVFRSGEATLTNACVKWGSNGFRLPTEAEWEVAARGRLEGKRFPWGDQITHQNANYSSKASASYDKSSQRGVPLAYSGQLPHTAPVGSFKSNGFGLYDLAGNVAEWCWDFYDKHYGIAELNTAASGADALALPAVKDPRGPESGATSVVRGGSWRHDAPDARCASRFDLPVSVQSPHVGFRVVRNS
jgi:formylglycine-generating enzyme required for sulfatase activity